jgi:hypothetical protein
MSGGGVKSKVQHNDRTMANTLPKAKFWPSDNCCGIHGAAKKRAGIKHGTVCARRRHDKEVIQQELTDLPSYNEGA